MVICINMSLPLVRVSLPGSTMRRCAGHVTQVMGYTRRRLSLQTMTVPQVIDM
jgi:hypothetical protein